VKIKPIELFQRFPSLNAKQRKTILHKRDVQLRKTLISIMIRHLKELYCDRYEKAFKRKCIWRWMTKTDAHWRELARNLIEFEQEPERFMEFAWCCKPMQNKHPPLAWMKSPLTVERSLSWSPEEIEGGVNWHESRDYQRRLRQNREDEARIEREERERNASRCR
jgi:hypothetical protein